MERRGFLKRTVGGIGVLAGSQFATAGVGPGLQSSDSAKEVDLQVAEYQAPAWLRYVRAVYFDGFSPPVYPHMKDFDAARLLRIVQELGGDTLRFQPMSYYWVYYPSKVYPMHPELENRDLIDEVSRECRRQGVHLYCYAHYGEFFMEVSAVERYPQYAGWVRRDPDGKPYGRNSHLGWTVVQMICTTGDAYREGIRRIVREYCEHDIDGVYFDSPSDYRGVCFCDSCRKKFKEFSGIDIERLRDDYDLAAPARDPEARVAWYEWANKLTQEDLLDFREIIHGSGKFMLCHNGATWEGPSLPKQYRIPDGFMVEHSSQVHQRLLSGLMGASMARPYKKLAQMYLGSYTVTDMGQPEHERPWATHNTNLEDGDEISMEGLVNLACGNSPIYSTANRLYFGVGSGTAEPAKEIFDLMRRVEPIHKDSISVPYVTIVPSWESLQLWRTNRQSWNGMMNEGFTLAMLDERISFDVNPSTEMSEEWLNRQRVIAFCGASGMSDDQAAMLAAWVNRGGGLLATYDTGLYNERGQLREDGGALREVLGVKMKGQPIFCQAECYYRFKRSHPALGKYGEGAVIQGDSQLVPVEVKPGAEMLADCWNLGTNDSRGPAIVVNQCGKGRSIYVSGSLEAHYVSSRVRSSREALASMVSYLAGEVPLPFGLSAPSGIYGVLRRATNGDLVLWVLGNVGFKDADIGRMRQEYMPVPNVEVRVLVPEGRRVKNVYLVRSGRSIPFEVVGRYAVATIPTLHIAEVVHVLIE